MGLFFVGRFSRYSKECLLIAFLWYILHWVSPNSWRGSGIRLAWCMLQNVERMCKFVAWIALQQEVLLWPWMVAGRSEASSLLYTTHNIIIAWLLHSLLWYFVYSVTSPKLAAVTGDSGNSYNRSLAEKYSTSAIHIQYSYTPCWETMSRVPVCYTVKMN